MLDISVSLCTGYKMQEKYHKIDLRNEGFTSFWIYKARKGRESVT